MKEQTESFRRLAAKILTELTRSDWVDPDWIRRHPDDPKEARANAQRVLVAAEAIATAARTLIEQLTPPPPPDEHHHVHSHPRPITGGGEGVRAERVLP